MYIVGNRYNLFSNTITLSMPFIRVIPVCIPPQLSYCKNTGTHIQLNFYQRYIFGT